MNQTWIRPVGADHSRECYRRCGHATNRSLTKLSFLALSSSAAITSRAAEMRRFFVVMAVLCAFASVIGSALTGAMAAEVGSTTAAFYTGPSSYFCATARTDGDQAPAFHPCGKMRNGLAVQCHADPGVLPWTGHGELMEISTVADSAIFLAPPRGEMQPSLRPPRTIESTTDA